MTSVTCRSVSSDRPAARGQGDKYIGTITMQSNNFFSYGWLHILKYAMHLPKLDYYYRRKAACSEL